jgi:glycosyltransferase involved in cell wall biosynthesis
MNIGIDIRCLMGQNHSGVANYAFNLIEHILKLDSTNNYKLFLNSAKTVAVPDFKQLNVQYFDFAYSNKRLNLQFKLFNSPKVDQLIKGCDLFFLPNINFISLSAKIPTVITVHDLSFEINPQYFSAKSRLWHKLINPRKLLNHCAKIIAVSANTKNDLIKLYNIPADKIKVISSGIADDLKPLDEKETSLFKIRSKYALPNEFILYLGNLESRKNIVNLIKAFADLKKQERFKHLNLVLAGSPGYGYNEIKNTAQTCGFNSQIKFIQYIPENEKKFLYNLAQAFVFPSFYEGFGFPPLEAQKCGIPVIASANSAMLENLKNSALLINPFKINDLTKALEIILTNDKLRKELITKGKANAERFDWAKTAEQTLAYFLK